MRVEGYVEGITRSGARGWAWSPASPDAVVQVEAIFNGRVIGRAVADRMRPDLKMRNYGNGFHGFEMSFDVLVTGETAPTLHVSGPDGPTRLPGAYEIRPTEMPEPGAGNQFVSEESRVAPPPLPMSPKGYVEIVTRRGARGWAWSPSSPDAAVQVEAVVDGRVIGRATADRLRPDLRKRSFGTGRYGFDMSFDEPVTGENLPRMHVIAPEGSALLPGDYVFRPSQLPETLRQIESVRPNGKDIVTSLPVSPEGYVEKVTRWTASGWAWLPASPDTIVQVEAILDGRVIGHAAADRMREDLKGRNFGTGRHGFELSFVEPVRGENAPTLQVIGPDGPMRLPGAHKLPPLETPELTAPPNAPSVHPGDGGGAPRLNPQGYVESVTRQGARGWAWTPSSPDTIVQVEAIVDGRVIGRAQADRPRPDLLARNIGTGRYGFAMSFDEHATGENAPEFRVLVPWEQCLPGVKTLPLPAPEDGVPRCRSSIATWNKEHAAFTCAGPDYEEFNASLLDLPTAPGLPRPLLMAFYLPQFHTVPENDLFWGAGFTEWRQIVRGASRFPGHYQPRIPRDLGFYDLNNLSTLRAQAELAKAAGISAFAFYYYWFNGQRVLEKPLNMLLASNLDMPFMILWANENWTRTWDGSESEVLLRQDYRQEDEDALLKDLARHFLDDRYVRVAGRPLFCIYNPQSIPNAAATVARWRSLLASRYALEPLIFMAQTFGARDPRDYGFDGALEFPPHKTAEKLVGRLMPDAYTPGYSSQILTYDSFVKTSLNEDPVEYPLIKTVVPSWDNESRRPNRSLTLEGLSPAKYQEWLRTLLARAMEKPILGTPIVAINAWNEWAEAAYLEPDVYYGASFLNATARAYSAALREYMSVGGSVHAFDGRGEAFLS